jgi:2-polyprenyl-3-methyl-5-hydroxy-6-metoxy-1,4-benzoquinol methylase
MEMQLAKKTAKVITKSPIKKSKAYYRVFGPVKWTSGYADFYRFTRVKRYLLGDSILDVGCGKADFLNFIKNDYRISGIEVNRERATYCNQVLGQDVVQVGNLEQGLRVESNSFDTVTCLELLEHLPDPESALKELLRISRKRVIITVPYKEEIRYVLCMHCGRYTSATDHLHSFNRENIRSIVPDGVRVVKIQLLANRVLSYLPGLSYIFRLPILIGSFIDNILNRTIPHARWMMVILDKK